MTSRRKRAGCPTIDAGAADAQTHAHGDDRAAVATLLAPDPANPNRLDDETRAGLAVTFRAAIPGKASAIDIHGETGARLTLEIADEDLADFLPVVRLRGLALRVTIGEDVG